MRYRPEIDGLRAIAVIAVVLFHAGVPAFNGGFVGVDVFFVISGFLITSILLRDIKEDRFSLLRFWERRARRILPALVTVVLFVTIIGLFVLTPEDIELLGLTVASQSVFASNIVFWQESDYFARTADSLPLLHTWSLAVEEQFYILFPISLFLITKIAMRLRWGAVLAVTLFSFLLSGWVIDRSPVAGFYLLPFRAWELGIGSLLALWISHSTTHFRSHRIPEIASASGFALIAYAVFAFSPATVFPGFNAAIPVIGTGLIIWANAHTLTYTGRLIALKPFVWVGLISYSLYLWHWPLFVYFAYPDGLAPTNLSPGMKIALIVASFVISWMSWKFIETPFRKHGLLPQRRRLLGTAVSVLALIAAVGFIAGSDGTVDWLVDDRAAVYASTSVSPTERQRSCHFQSASEIGALETADDFCRFGPEDAELQFVLWGDSHAAHLVPVIDKLSTDESFGGIHASYSECPGILWAGFGHRPTCKEFNQTVTDVVRDSGIRNVVLSAFWPGYYGGENLPLISDETGDPQFVAEGSEVIANYIELTANWWLQSGVQVWLVRDVPRLSFDPNKRLFTASKRGDDLSLIGVEYTAYEELLEPMDSAFARLEERGAIVIDIPAVLCSEGFCPVVQDEIPLYRDSHHLSHQGALLTESAFSRFAKHLIPTR